MSTQTTQGRDPANLFRDVQGAVSAVESGDWVTAGLGMANTAMDIVGMASNPLSGFLSAGFSWAMEHVDFLREPFDALLGDPQAISKMSESWKSAGTQVASVATDYRRTSVEQTRNWQGRTADAYRTAAANHSTGLETLSKACAGISHAVAGAGQLVAAVRKMIMDLIADAVAKMVMKIIQWLAASFCTFGAAIGAAIADIVTMACNYAKKLSDFLSKLASSLTKLMNLVKQVSSIAQIAKQVVDAITAMSHQGASGGSGGAGPDSTRPSAGGLGMDQGQVDRLRQEAGQGYTNPGSAGGGGAGGGTTGTSGSSGGQVSTPPTVPGTGGHWEPGRWVPDAPAASGGGQVSAPPLVGGSGGGSGGVPGGAIPRSTPTIPSVPPVRPVYSPAASSGDLHTTSTHPVSGFSGSLSGGSGGGAGGFSGGGSVGGFSGGGSGGGAGGGFSAGGGGAAGGGGGPTQPGGATGILPSSTPGHASLAGGGGGGGAGGGAPHGPGGGGGAAGGGMMGGAPMGGGQGGGGGKDHQRKIRIEGEELMEPPKAAKPVIGE
jgi:uncharacterized protein YukE